MTMSSSRIRRILEWSEGGMSQRQIAAKLGIGKGTVQRITTKADDLHLTSVEAHSFGDHDLVILFYPSKGEKLRFKVVPDYMDIHNRITHTKHRSLMHEWLDYRRINPDGYEYARFCQLYSEWCGEMEVHPKLLTDEVPGQCIYLDWAGDTIECIFEGINKPVTVYFFVTSLGASELPYVEPMISMDAMHYASAFIHALDYYGGIPKYVIPDNTKAAVIWNRDKEFELNPLFEEMEDYYGYTVLPARPYSPTDKNDVEANVHRAEDYIISDLKLDELKFKSLDEVKAACRMKLDQMVTRKFKGTDFSRLEWFRKIDYPELMPKKKDFVLYHHEYVTVPASYHVHIKHDQQQYSVPYKYIGHEVILKYSDTDLFVEDKDTGEIIAQWNRVHRTDLNTVNTLDGHRPPNHQIAMALKVKDSEWYREQAAGIGPNTLKAINIMLEAHKTHPEAIYRACMGVISLAWNSNRNKCTYAELEKACDAAIRMKSVHYKTIKNYIRTEREEKKENAARADRKHLPEHSNIRDNSIYK